MILRRATPDDAPACAAIVARWIAGTDWMPGGPSKADLEAIMREGFPKREVWLAETDGEVLGYLSLKEDASHIFGLYTAQPGGGVGRALMDKVKEGRNFLKLRSHAPNTSAHRFYEREGFVITERDLEGSDGVPELEMEWHR